MVSVSHRLRGILRQRFTVGVAVDYPLRLRPGGVDETAPAIQTLAPADNATNVSIASNLVATFNERIAFGAAVVIELRLTSDDSAVESWDETDIDAGISISNRTLTINPTSDLDNDVEYYVHIENGSIEDLSGNAFAGITETDWSFTTVAADGQQFVTTFLSHLQY